MYPYGTDRHPELAHFVVDAGAVAYKHKLYIFEGATAPPPFPMDLQPVY